MEYSNDIDEGVFYYEHYVNTVYRSKLKWSEKPKLDLILFDKVMNTTELEKGLRIGKIISL